MKKIWIVFSALAFCCIYLGDIPRDTETLQRAFTELRFGAFFHYGIRTYTGQPWATPSQDVSQFNPTDLDCGQWIDAIRAAGMKFAILTTKHHDGFCLWDSKYTENDVASSPWQKGTGDVVREFVNACRAREILPCLYYSVWDNTAGIGNGPITPEQMETIKGQLTELLTSYGPISMLFIDGWSWKMGHKAVPYDEIRNLVKSLQPNCLLVDNTHLPCLYHNDLIHFEDGSPCPDDNTLPAILSLLINKSGGNGWFWAPDVPNADLLTVGEVVQNLKFLEAHWCNFIINCPPNPEGKLDSSIVSRLKEIGKAWQPDMSRPALPAQGPFMEYPITPDTALASSGNAAMAIDGLNDRFFYSVWETDTILPQSITIDLGKVYPDVNMLTYVPKYQPKLIPLKQGSIKSFRISVSKDSQSFSNVANGEWNGDTHMKVATFSPVAARFVRLEVFSAVDNFVAATEIAVGRANSDEEDN